MNKLLKRYVWILLTFALETQVFACTTIIVGAKASDDGSVIIARNADADPTEDVYVMVHPQHTNPTGALYKSQGSDFSWPLPPISYKYSSTPEWQYVKTDGFGEAGINEKGVAMSETETIYSNAKTAAIDPYVKNGIGEIDLLAVILPFIKTPQEGVILLGKIIEKYGASEGFGVAFANNQEAWYLESAGAHHWIAARIPDDAVFVSPNQGRIQQIDLKDSRRFLGSHDLITYAEQQGLYDAKTDGAFDVRKVYHRLIPDDVTYNYRRLWELLSKLNPIFHALDYTQGQFPVFIKASHPVSKNEVATLLRNHFEGTANDPYHLNNPQEPNRPVAVFRAESSHIIVMNSHKTPNIGNVLYLALGMENLSPYLPFYQGITTTPIAYREGNNYPDDRSAYWHYRKLQILTMIDYSSTGPIVEKSLAIFEKELQAKQNAMETEYLTLAAKDPKAAETLLNTFTDQTCQSGIDWADTVLNQLFDLQLQKINNRFRFSGA